jgi:NitT/TauT family transport system substrate-binding protein
MRRSLLLSGLASVAALARATRAAAQTPDLPVVRIATPGNDGNALAFYAQALGLFKKYGIDAQIQAIRSGGGATILAGIVGKALDVGESDVIGIASAYEHGVPITLLAPSYMFRTGDLTSVIITGRNSSINTAKDLNGKTIGVTSLGGVGRLLTTKWLQTNGADLTTIKFVEVPQISMAAALARGTIAAAQDGEPNVTAAGDDVRVLASTYAAVGKQVQATAWCASPDWVRANPESAKRFAAAIHDAAVWADDPRNHARSAAILQQWLPFPNGLAEKMHRAYYGQVFDVSALQPLLDTAVELKALSAKIDVRDLISPLARVS